MIRRFILVALALASLNAFAGSFRIATYNVENYIDQPTDTRNFVKADNAKTKIRENILALNPDVIVLGTIAIHTGDFAIFLESDDSWITNVGSQSDWQQLYLAPGKEPQGVNSPQLFPLSIHTRITRIIYNDGLSCASWPVR